MKLLRSVFFILTASMLAQSVSVFAAVAKKKVPVQEIYSATEGDEATALAVQAPASITMSNRADKSAQPLPRPLASVPAPAKLPDSALAYDPVPSDQVDALSKRLQLVDLLIRRHARAYDYRTHTVRELELILAKLEASASMTTASTR